MKVFLSYSSKDAKTASLISHALKNKNISVIRDDTKIRPGTNIIERINESVENIDAVIVLISRNYLSSKFTQQELLTWRLKDKVVHDFGILFVVIDNVQYLVLFKIMYLLILKVAHLKKQFPSLNNSSIIALIVSEKKRRNLIRNK